MELLTGTRWHGVRFRGEDEHEDGGRPSKRLRLSKSISVLQPVARLVRSPLDTIGNLAESLGYNARPTLSPDEERKQVYLARLQTAETYDEWRTAALELDELEGGAAWKVEEESDIYDVTLVRARLQSLESARENRDFGRMRFLTRTSLTRDLGGMGNVSLYKHSRVGTKALIEHYIDTVVDTIEMVVEEAGAGVGRGRDAKRVWEEMKLARQSFGRSALLLSGGGTLGMNHIGVVKALFEAGLLPRIISGASAGSIVCAVLCTKTDPEIPDVLHEFCHGELDVFESEGEGLLHKITRFFTQGAIYDISNLKRVMEGLIGTITFQEAYNRTRRILNICVSNAGLYEMPRLLNYVTAPDVMIASAVAASCAVPSVFSAADLLAKDPKTGRIKHFDDSPSKWIDGSVDNDLPMMRLAEMLNVNHFIVSQVNPHVVPFLAREEDEAAPETSAPVAAPLALAPGPGWINSAANLAKSEALHRMHVLAELGVFPNVMTKVRSVIGQRYAGDITIMPEISYAQFPNILRNPTETFMVQALRNGEHATWPKLSRIRNHLAVELKLDWAVRKMMTRVAFSQSQVDLRMNVFARPVRNGRSERGRSRPGSKTARRVIQSMHERPTTAVSSPIFAQRIAGPEPTDYASSTDDEARSPRSTSPTPVTDDDDNSSDAASDASESPSSPPPDLWPANRYLFPSASQPATPSIASKAFLSDSPTSTRALTPLPADLVITPSPPIQRTSSPEMKYKRLFHGKLSPMPTIRSQAGTPEPQDSPGQKGAGLFRRRSKTGLGLELPGTRGYLKRRSRRNSTGAPGLRPPDKR
ncbi:Lipase 5 [Friedmanniomyces endolithicus]|uniref:Patatin-like phospholipase domain-containing protein n=1 Tax=Friedmanniomyces endolithicus TaxID=329885 RepID=A0AAN6F691_9PEZI|nr:Lipase 5 [Friedmanniomyces endolithicus]KAK0269299.1 Lipase 5 [Friedmanniomyces endolithicus]KAK0304419.1 Lipase 5 [Friedmanniomyces endolithicus]KAK0920563.1 Lipase 5 [Friedmanniomyces endolithicus]KAK0974900.1 Lipase 5 [Friedmanniomyces endolithicus]